MMSRLITIYVLLKYRVLRVLQGGTMAARFLGVKVGEDCRIYSKSFGSEPWLIDIGSRVTLTEGVCFITHDGSGCLVHDEKGRRYRYARIVLGNDVFVGVNSIIMPGIRVGDHVVIAAGSVVTKSVPNGVVVAGNPARIIMRYDEFEARVRQRWCTEDQMKGSTYQERINSVLEPGFKPEMKLPD